MNLDDLTVLPILKNLIGNINYTRDVLAVIGLFYAAKATCNIVYRSWTVFKTYFLSRFLCARNLSSKYGGEWAVVTGASEGIGRSYALKLAERHMNILLISRNLDKLRKTAEEIRSKYKVQTKCFAMDLSDISSEANYIRLEEEIKSIDVGILVNNVGIMYDSLQYFLAVPMERHVKIINLNITATVLLTNLVLPGMVGRRNGAIINLSSVSSIHPTPLMATYASAKKFVEVFTRTLEYEYSSNGITFQVIRPSYVSTAMTYNAKKNFFVCESNNYVDSSIRTLGQTSRCFGHFSHALFGGLGEMLPERLYMFSALYIHPFLYRHLIGDNISIEKTD